MATMKMNIIIQKWLFQIGWIINKCSLAILCAYIKTQNPNVNMKA